MSNKTILITGATAGIGLETAKTLAKQGHIIYITARNKEKGCIAIDTIKQFSNNNNIHFFIADLSSQQEIRKLATEITNTIKKLDVLINNAGATFQYLSYSVDNIEMTFATNHLSYFLLTNLLLDLMKTSAPSRIVNVSSGSHYKGTIDFDDLYMVNKYHGLKAYERSKVCNVLFTLELAERLKGTGVTVNALHPGRVKTDIGGKNSGLFFKVAWGVFKFISAIPVEQGAETSVYLATSDEVKDITGKYFDECKVKEHSAYSRTSGLKEKLWTVSESLVKLR